jgi:hypothetical protein
MLAVQHEPIGGERVRKHNPRNRNGSKSIKGWKVLESFPWVRLHPAILSYSRTTHRISGDPSTVHTTRYLS